MEVDVVQIVSSTAEPAFGTDEQGRIVIWNRAAERLLGYGAAEVLGRPCCTAVGGRDVFGNRFCDDRCPLYRMVERHEPICRFELCARSRSKEYLRLEVSIIVVPGPRESHFTVIHLLHQADRPVAHEAWVPQIASLLPPVGEESTTQPAQQEEICVLTGREIDVLRMLAEGQSTQQIADLLLISITTVRNHTQNILRKLEAHSKYEAVALALRKRLI